MKAEAGEKKTMNRREMFGRVWRWAGLLALGAVVARLTFGRRNGGTSEGPRRPFSSRCGACPAINVCLLPEAEAARVQGVGLIGASRGAPGAGPVRPLCRATPTEIRTVGPADRGTGAG